MEPMLSKNPSYLRQTHTANSRKERVATGDADAAFWVTGDFNLRGTLHGFDFGKGAAQSRRVHHGSQKLRRDTGGIQTVWLSVNKGA